jgi:hypothetical protein
MYLNHNFAIHLYCKFPTILQLIRSMGSFDVPLGPAPSCRSFVVLGTKRLLIFACVHLAEPLASNIDRNIWEFIIWSKALLVSELCCSSKNSITSFLHFSFYSDSEYYNAVQRRYPARCVSNWNFILVESQ